MFLEQVQCSSPAVPSWTPSLGQRRGSAPIERQIRCLGSAGVPPEPRRRRPGTGSGTSPPVDRVAPRAAPARLLRPWHGSAGRLPAYGTLLLVARVDGKCAGPQTQRLGVTRKFGLSAVSIRQPTLTLLTQTRLMQQIEHQIFICKRRTRLGHSYFALHENLGQPEFGLGITLPVGSCQQTTHTRDLVRGLACVRAAGLRQS